MGQDTSGMSEKERAFCRNRNIGFVFQSFHLIQELSALDNVKLSIQFYNLHEKKKIPGRIATERSREVLMSLGMEQHIHKRPMQLSGGQKQRVAIARALVNNPELMLPRRGQECPLVLFQGLYAELAHHLPGHFDISHAVGALYSSGKILAAQTGDNQQSAQELAAFVDIHADAVLPEAVAAQREGKTLPGFLLCGKALRSLSRFPARYPHFFPLSSYKTSQPSSFRESSSGAIGRLRICSEESIW
jgi:hypothetical protein